MADPEQATGEAQGAAAPRGARRSLIVATALLITLLAAEIGLRVVLAERLDEGFQRRRPEEAVGVADAEVGWRLRGNLDTEFQGRGFRYGVRTDAHGWRDSPREPPTVECAQRVVVLGDSFLWGWGVERSERVSDLLQVALAGNRTQIDGDQGDDGNRINQSETVEVINRAVPGYSTDQELWVLQQVGESLRPDVVILGVNTGDARQNARTLVPPFPKPCYRPAPEGGWRLIQPGDDPDETADTPVAPLAATRRGPVLWRLVTGSLPLGEPERLYVRDPRLPPVEEHPYAAGSTTHMLLGRIAGTCRRLNARLILVGIADPPEASWLDNPDLDLAEPDQPLLRRTRRLAEIAAELGCDLVVIDAAEIAAIRGGGSLRIPGDWHWNVQGNRVLAEALVPVVRAALRR